MNLSSDTSLRLVLLLSYSYWEIIISSFQQHHRGRGPQQDAWVLGLVDTQYTPALGYMELVQTRDAAPLLPIIQAHTAPGTKIHSDQWRTYNQVATLPMASQS